MYCSRFLSQQVIKNGKHQVQDATRMQNYLCKTCRNESEGWTLNGIERQRRYWVTAKVGKRDQLLFETGLQTTW